MLKRDSSSSGRQIARFTKKGTESMIKAVQVGHPTLSAPEAAKVVNVFMVEASKHLANGENLAFVKQNPTGTVQITIVEMKIHDTKAGQVTIVPKSKWGRGK